MTRGELAFVAGAADAGKRLDVALAARPEVGSRAAAQRLLESGAATVDGRARPKSQAGRQQSKAQAGGGVWLGSYGNSRQLHFIKKWSPGERLTVGPLKMSILQKPTDASEVFTKE